MQHDLFRDGSAVICVAIATRDPNNPLDHKPHTYGPILPFIEIKREPTSHRSPLPKVGMNVSRFVGFCFFLFNTFRMTLSTFKNMVKTPLPFFLILYRHVYNHRLICVSAIMTNKSLASIFDSPSYCYSASFKELMVLLPLIRCPCLRRNGVAVFCGAPVPAALKSSNCWLRARTFTSPKLQLPGMALAN